MPDILIVGSKIPPLNLSCTQELVNCSLSLRVPSFTPAVVTIWRNECLLQDRTPGLLRVTWQSR